MSTCYKCPEMQMQYMRDQGPRCRKCKKRKMRHMKVVDIWICDRCQIIYNPETNKFKSLYGAW